MDHHPPITPISTISIPVPTSTHPRVSYPSCSLVGVLGIDLVSSRLLVRAAEAIGDHLALVGGEGVAGLLGDGCESYYLSVSLFASSHSWGK